MKIYQLTMNSWQWPILFKSEEAAAKFAVEQFRYLFSAHRYYLSEPYRYRTWGGTPSVSYKIMDRQADSVCPGFSRASFEIQELTKEQLLQRDKGQRESSFELIEMQQKEDKADSDNKPELTNPSVERGPSSRR